MLKIISVFGTRPEAIKMVPIVQQLSYYNDRIISKVCVTGQHRQMIDQVLNLFQINPEYDLNIMEADQSPMGVAISVIKGIEPILLSEQPDWVLVQGDTTTVMATSLAAFHRRIKIGHVEAGLRTHDRYNPFPEEVNRRITAAMAELHFSPTKWAANNLRREGIPKKKIIITGNTVIDAVNQVAAMPFDPGSIPKSIPLGKKKILLVTVHRRETFGRGLEEICSALRAVAKAFDIHLVYPVHPNPNVWKTVHRLLEGVPNISLLPPLDYLPMISLMKQAYIVLTDSGGIQEEAPSLGIPVLVLREVTERPEGVKAGTVRVVGTNKEKIFAEVARLLEDKHAYQQMAQAVNPYGDGHAAKRIVKALLENHIEPWIGPI